VEAPCSCGRRDGVHAPGEVGPAPATRMRDGPGSEEGERVTHQPDAID